MPSWVTPSGVRLTGRAPASAGDVLEVQALAITPLALSETDGTPPSAHAVRALLGWCARHTEVVEVDGEPCVPISEALDACLVPAEQVAWARRLIAAASLDERIERAGAAYLDILADGGCECAWCAPKEGKKAPAERPRACLLRSIPEAVRALIVSWWPLRSSVSASSPYWSHQLAARWAASVARVQAAARKKHELRDHTHTRLKERGII